MSKQKETGVAQAGQIAAIVGVSATLVFAIISATWFLASSINSLESKIVQLHLKVNEIAVKVDVPALPILSSADSLDTTNEKQDASPLDIKSLKRLLEQKWFRDKLIFWGLPLFFGVLFMVYYLWRH